MARIFTQAEATHLGLPGRNSVEILSRKKGTQSVTLRLVEIPVAVESNPNRLPHSHSGFEECIFVLSGFGVTVADSGDYPLKAGDTLWIPAGEKHYTRNTGDVPLELLCFFPVGDVGGATNKPVPDSFPPARL